MPAVDERPLGRWELAIARAIVAGLLLAIVGATLVTADFRSPEGFAAKPPTPAPPVEANEILPVDRQTAEKINEAVPFVSGPNPAAKPFVLTGSEESRARAVDCLAAAIHYEAGAETNEGQEAVAQVVLNRVRHPAYPKTVCGVVFQGQERATGCQFTFTCNGDMARIASAVSWARARAVAKRMVSGTVYKPVGLATHYHTNWVVPYWSASLAKIRAEGTHLFFRWKGYWGTPPAFAGRYASVEGNVAKLAALSPVHIGGGPLELDGAPVELASLKPLASDASGNTMSFALAQLGDPSSLVGAAKSACGPRAYCKIFVWTDPRSARDITPVDDASRARLVFTYLRDDRTKFEKPLWNCAIHARVSKGDCMRVLVPAKPTAVTAGLIPADPDIEPETAAPVPAPRIEVSTTAPRRRPGS